MILPLLLAAPAETLARLAEPWARWYSDSKALASAVVFLHLVPLVVAGGVAWSADLATMRAARGAPQERARQLTELSRTHRAVVGGLVLSFVSGVLLLLSDVKTFLPAPLFWLKLGLVTALLGNGWFMMRTERALAGNVEGEGWARLRALAVGSLALWIATTLVGVLLTNYA